MTSFFDDSLQQNSDALQSALTGLNFAVSDSNFGYENHSKAHLKVLYPPNNSFN